MRTRWLDAAGLAALCMIVGAGSALAQSTSGSIAAPQSTGSPIASPPPSSGFSGAAPSTGGGAMEGVQMAPGLPATDLSSRTGPTGVPVAPGESGLNIPSTGMAPGNVPIAPGPAGRVSTGSGRGGGGHR